MINPGRTIVVDSLRKVLKELHGKDSVSEHRLKHAWLEEIRGNGNLTVNGWYSPPSAGMAVLSCQDDTPERSHFQTFRDPQFFASSDNIDWSSSSIIFYASNIDLDSGLPADFATTVYFGNNKSIRRHFRDSFGACSTLLSELDNVQVGQELYGRMEDILAARGLTGRTWSSTDNDYNFGHTLPRLNAAQGLSSACHEQVRTDPSPAMSAAVTDFGAEAMRTARKFLSRQSELDLLSGVQFTIEPQCISLLDEKMPKVMIHYVAQHNASSFDVCRSCDELPREYGLL